LSNLAADLKAGRVGALVVWGANPAYAAPGFADLIKKATFSLALTDRLDETASLCTYAAPVPHYLESWNDYTPVAGHYAVAQPTIAPLFDSKPAQEVLMSLLGDATSYKDVVRSAVAARGLSVNAILHDGGVQLSDGASGAGSGAAAKALAGASVAAEEAAKAATGEWEVVFYQKAVGAGFQANNPWLHELPDPISRVTWDNYVTISAADALKLGVENTSESNGAINGSYLTLTVNGTTLERVPAWIQPGQAAGTLGLALGYGRTKVGKVADNVGVNAYSLMKSGSAYVVAKVTLAEDEHEFASVQLGNTMMGRKIVNETTLATFLADSTGKSWNEKAEFHTLQGTVNANEANLWPDHDHKTMHMWNMSIDLNSGIGCGACVVACHIENNVPVVGKDEVRRFRDMHWLRIDRYYSSDTSHESAEADGVGVMAKYAAMEVPSASPEVVFQPVMCQHCNHAPCETVCPVAARGIEPHDLQPVHWYALLREQLPVQGSSFQLVQLHEERQVQQRESVARRFGPHGVEPGRNRAFARCHGEVLLLHPAHPVRQVRSQEERRTHGGRRLYNRLCPGMLHWSAIVWRRQQREERRGGGQTRRACLPLVGRSWNTTFCLLPIES
jgi:molybdopterin-containing oxidoreductase family iron-sulfur binding subunit